MDKHYKSNRLTGGNFLFPDEVTVAEDGIHFIKRRVFGSDEEIITYRKIASVRVTTSMFFADLAIETSGGSQPVFINGLGKNDAQEIKNAIRKYQVQEE
jgi:hypothetical protein